MRRPLNSRDFVFLQLLTTILSFALPGCSKEPVVQLPTAEDRRIAKKAIAPNEILLMVRGGYREREVIAEATARRVSEVVDSITENKLLDAGATEALLKAMKSKEHVLTVPQKIAYDEDQTERQQQMESDLGNRRSKAAAEETARLQELRRRQGLQQETLANIEQKEQQEAQYQQADKNYRSRRQALEQQTQYLEASINRRRGRGCSETDLRADNQTLENYREQLRNLVSPLRPF